MGGIGDIGKAVGDGIGGLMGGVMDALRSTYEALVGTFQNLLPGPWLPIVIVGAVIVLGWLVLKR